MIAVTGASGQVGGRVARALPTARTPRVRYHDTEGMRTALEGVDTLLMVSARESPDRLGEHKNVVDAAVQAKVRKVVYLSFAGAAPDCTFTFGRDHFHTERYIAERFAAFVFLRDNLYQEMLPKLVGVDGVIRGPAGDGRVAAVAYDDIAEAAVTALQTAEHDGRTFTLTGPEALTLHEVAARIGARYEPETLEEAYASRRHFGAPDFEVDGWVTSYQAIANGELGTVTDHVERLTGHPGKSFTPTT